MLEKCHFIGIGGIGMSGLAHLILNQEGQVSGSDLAFSATTDFLSKKGAKVFIGHSASHIEPATTVIYTTGIKKDNPEYLAAMNLKCPLLHRSELLQKLMENNQSLTIAGTHGKTTTSSLLTWVLEVCGQYPSYAIGGVIPQLSSNSRRGTGNYFVAEACESDGTFLNYTPYGAIVTNIGFDHMDFYKTQGAIISAFKEFIGKVASEKYLFWCGDDPHLRKINPKGTDYGFGPNCQLRASNFQQKGWMLSIDIDFKGKVYKKVEVALTGKHNALNALAVFGLALKLGMDDTTIRSALCSFGGVLRRCEKKADIHGILCIDDYAHYPTEIKATLSAIREAIGERRLVVVYQPHRYTRTKDCLGMYENIFDPVDLLFITEIYGAHEDPIPGISHEMVIAEVKELLGNRCRYLERSNIALKLAEVLRPHDVLVTLGAGDVTQVTQELKEMFVLKTPKKLKLGLIFGGMSVEHDISLISCANIYAALRQEYYEIEHFGINRQGTWISGPQAIKQLENQEEPNQSPKLSLETLTSLLECDILFPVLHGTLGEDGTIQGFFDLLSKAYVGCDHRSAAISMDKVLAKRLASEAGVAILPFLSFNRHEWERDQERLIQKIHEKLTYPLFVKPIHLGSSIGVHKVINEASLRQAIKHSFRFDAQLVVENGIENVREIEFSLIGNHEITVFPPGEVHTNGKVHDYDSKYGLNPSKAAAQFDTRARLSEKKINEGMALAKAVYQIIGCMGMARVDTFLDSNEKFWFNEINPIPGFTKYSLYPLMCHANGLPLNDLIDRLIVLGLHRRRQIDRLEL